MNLIEEYNLNTKAFVQFIKEIADDDFNKKPEQNTWSAAENVEHIIRSEFGTARLFNSDTKKEPNRDSESKIKEIKTRFTDRSKKLQAFGVVLPTDGKKNKEELIAKFLKSREMVIQLIKEQNPDEVCMKFAHPLFGYMTRKEWIHFNIVHANRHIHQIEALLTSLNKI
ncbi:MAG: DinB family protein [Balneola sp.]|jgi:uncharacterized damage-inducible protein DinB|nr:hypothetical protein [Bacteroidota bacterium]MBO6622646.1 DinB family protein [Balneola sp.]MBO6649912.1 DinB family protein [Balneola sp.]MBO6711741.1 DinB family protein [Balneola sp.]MBO6799935.1 DinB family protein [Balneola sp.]|tara:strand:+ start:15672 stop:16178 length:507 start_codon:yes stop_codon:yes gene_type:complete